MTLTLLVIGGLVIAAAAVVATTARGYQTSPALAGENTVVGLNNADTLVGHCTPAANESHRTEWHLTTVSALCDAEDLLDSLEMQGFEERELVVLGNSCFAIRWR